MGSAPRSWTAGGVAQRVDAMGGTTVAGEDLTGTMDGSLIAIEDGIQHGR